MKVFNTSPWIILAVLFGLGSIGGLAVAGFTFRNLPAGMRSEFTVDPREFLTVEASLKLDGRDINLHGVIRCRVNPYPGLSDQEDFSYPDGFVKEIAPGRQVILVVRSVCTESAVEKGQLHFTVVDRKGDEAKVYMSDSPQLAGSTISARKTRSEDFERDFDSYVDNCDEDGFSNTGRIGVWHLPGETFVGDLVSSLGPPPQFSQIEGVNNYIDNTIGDRNITAMLRDWRVRPLGRDEMRVCASNDSFLGKGCLARVMTRVQGYDLAAIDGGTMPTIRIKDGVLQLGDRGVITAKRVAAGGYAHQLHLALRSGERFFYVQRLEYCYAPVWRN